MRPRDEVRLELTRQWLEKAETDYRIAVRLNREGAAYVYGTVFHAQQAAEKYLKAFLVYEGVEFPKTHDIGALLRLVSRVDTALAANLGEAVCLTPFGVEYCYPGDYPAPSLSDGAEAAALAGLARDAIRARLPAQTLASAD